MDDQKPAAVVIDHWPLVRLGVSRALGSVGVSVVGEAGSGSEAVQVCMQGPVDIIVLGDAAHDEAIEVTRAAKALPRPPKIVALLGRTSRTELIALLEAGADATVLRSVSAEDLAGTVHQVLNGERVVGAAFLELMVSAAPSDAASPNRKPAVMQESRAPDLLTAREREVLSCLANGATNQQIAGTMYVTCATVKTHLAHIYAKLKVRNRHEAVSRAVALGLLH